MKLHYGGYNYFWNNICIITFTPAIYYAKISLNIWTTYVSSIIFKTFDGKTNSSDPDQTAPVETNLGHIIHVVRAIIRFWVAVALQCSHSH